MGIDLIFKIAGIGIVVAVLNPILIKSGRDEQATLVTVAGLILTMIIISGEIKDLFTLLKSFFG
ncbi:MAG: stage III sporulation protein AC [Clostridia bacterium]|nr:stage III sporulation protein AC [Clostridia bacterium]